MPLAPALFRVILPCKFQPSGRCPQASSSMGADKAGRHRALVSLCLACLFVHLSPERAEAAHVGHTAKCAAVPDIDVVGFVESATKRPLPPICVRAVDQKELASFARATGLPEDGELAALYVPSRLEILIANDLDMSKLVDRSYLVHELVHVQQHATGAMTAAPCAGLLEAEAYATQASFIRANGSGKDAFVFSLLGMLQGACGQSVP